MAEPQLIIAIGRIERALSRIEQAPRSSLSVDNNDQLLARHERLISETKAAIAGLDQLISSQAQ